MKKKDIYYQTLSRTIQLFGPEFENSFICPLCLNISAKEDSQYTEAHILPKASGYTKSTLLCKTCNSKMGQEIDKFLAEHLNLVTGNKPFEKNTIMKTTMDGFRINYNIVQAENNDLKLIISEKNNNPQTLKDFLQHRSNNPHSFNFSVSMPVLGKKHEISMGMLNAAYLIGYSIYGYSWVMQEHMQKIRDAIIKNNFGANGTDFFVTKTNVGTKLFSWGIIENNSNFFFLCKLIDYVVIFPSYSACKFPKEFTIEGNVDIEYSEIENISFNTFQPPFMLVIDNKIILLPSLSEAATRNLSFIQRISWASKLTENFAIKETRIIEEMGKYILNIKI